MTAHQAVNSGPSGVTGASEWIASGTPVGERRGAGVHALGALRADGHRVVLVAPVEVVIGEQVDAHAERLHAAELRRVGELAVLQREAMVGRRMRRERVLDAIEHQLGRLVAVGVRVHQQALLERRGVDRAHRLGRRVPQAVRRAVVVAGPAQARREALDRAVGDDLDRAEPQPVACSARAARARARRAACGVWFISRSSDTMRAGSAGSAVTRSIMSTAFCGSRLARSVAVVTPLRTARRANRREPALVGGEQLAVEADVRRDRHHRVGALQLAGRQAVRRRAGRRDD